MELGIKLDKSKLRKKGYPVTFHIYVTNTDKLYPTTNYFAFPEEWDEERSEPKPNHPLYFSLYEYVCKKKIIINKIISENQNRTAAQIKSLLLGKNNDSLSTFWKEYIQELRLQQDDGNARYFESNLGALNQYNTDVLFKQIDYNFLIGYRDFHLSKVDAKGQKRVSNNGVIVYLKAMRKVYNLAVRRKVYIPTDATRHFIGVMPKKELTKDRDFNIDEMIQIYNGPKKTKYYDIFMICFLLGGIDYVDILNLRYEEIRNNRIKFERHKGATSEIINVPIYPEAWEILDKYKDDSGYLMPFLQIEEAKSEKYSFRDNYIRRFRTWLKKNTDIIPQNVTDFSSKTPRYTFINIGKKLMLSRDVLMEITGHSRGDVHAIYESNFPDHIRDEIHRKIIDSVLVMKNEKEAV